MELTPEAFKAFLNDSTCQLYEDRHGQLSVVFKKPSEPFDLQVHLTCLLEDGSKDIIVNVNKISQYRLPDYISNCISSNEAIEHPKLGVTTNKFGFKMGADMNSIHMLQLLPSYIRRNFPDIEVVTDKHYLSLTTSVEHMNALLKTLNEEDVEQYFTSAIENRIKALGQGAEVIELFRP